MCSHSWYISTTIFVKTPICKFLFKINYGTKIRKFFSNTFLNEWQFLTKDIIFQMSMIRSLWAQNNLYIYYLLPDVIDKLSKINFHYFWQSVTNVNYQLQQPRSIPLVWATEPLVRRLLPPTTIRQDVRSILVRIK